MFKGLLIVTLAASPLLASAENNNRAAEMLGPQTKAVVLGDKELDQVTAGIVVHVITNPGGPERGITIHNNLIQIMNPDGNGPTAGELTIGNHGQSFTRCLGKGC